MSMTTQERKTLNQLRKLAKEKGATVTVDRDFGCVDLRVTAASGFCFDGDLHEFVEISNQPWQPDYQDMLERLEGSEHEKCETVDCEWCNEA